MNKVLNRPLFRKAALKKGYLKPIHAQTGIMVGQPINNPNPQINPRTQVPSSLVPGEGVVRTIDANSMMTTTGDSIGFAFSMDASTGEIGTVTVVTT